MVAGPGVYICDECVEMCMDIVADAIKESETTTESIKYDLPKPKEIHETLSDYVIGQDPAKKLWQLPYIIIIKESMGLAIKTRMLICRRATSS